MRHIQGVYNGATVDLSEPLPLPPGTVVQVVVPETESAAREDRGLDADALDRAVLVALYRRGTIASIDPPAGTIDLNWQPIANRGRSLAEEILEDRR